MKAAGLQRVNPEASGTNWQDMATILLWVLNEGRPITITEANLKALLERYPGGPVIHRHGTEISIVLRLITKEQAKAEGLA
jgi:hypothetical protein